MIFLILSLVLTPKGTVACGHLPKQVAFSSTGKFLIVTLLGGTGFQVVNVERMKVIKTIKPGKDFLKSGFVEVFFLLGTDTFFVSQMNTDHIFECYIDTSGKVEVIKNYHSYGKWPKVMALSPGRKFLAVSNWLSSSVSIISYPDARLIKAIHSKNPRGLAFTPDEKYLIVASFGNGDIIRIKTDTWKEMDRIHIEKGAMRHVVMKGNGRVCYVSDMFHGRIYEVSIEPFIIKRKFRVYINPNTIDISPDERFLFVSCRGRNSKKGYLERSPENGKIYVIDLNTGKTIKIIEGGNQPTGLDVSPDGRYLAFSNFRDNNVEIFEIKP